MRLFVALDLPREIRSSIASFSSRLRDFCPDARWVPTDAVHLTLKFIGEVPQEIFAGIHAELLTVRSSPIEIAFRGAGFFPPSGRPRVFWCGIEAGPQLAALAATIEDVLAPLGIAKADRAFSPHITLARLDSARNTERLREAVSAIESKEGSADRPLGFGSMTASEFHLYRSVLKPGGSEYTRVASFSLAEELPR